ncbi:MAG: superoxide dismutase family protein [Polyangiales bacterium]
MTKTPLSLVLLLVACGGSTETTSEVTETESAGGETTVEVIRDDVPTDVVPAAVTATVSATEGNTVNGTVSFTQESGEVVVRVALTGFEPGTRHGFHVHETGDCSAPDGTSAGGHFNPDGHDHALPDSDVRHAGDLGNVEADANGNVNTEFRFTDLHLDGEHGIGGRAVILHASADDGGQPTGNAGPRVACGVISTL